MNDHDNNNVRNIAVAVFLFGLLGFCIGIAEGQTTVSLEAGTGKTFDLGYHGKDVIGAARVTHRAGSWAYDVGANYSNARKLRFTNGYTFGVGAQVYYYVDPGFFVGGGLGYSRLHNPTYDKNGVRALATLGTHPLPGVTTAITLMLPDTTQNHAWGYSVRLQYDRPFHRKYVDRRPHEGGPYYEDGRVGLRFTFRPGVLFFQQPGVPGHLHGYAMDATAGFYASWK